VTSVRSSVYCVSGIVLTSPRGDVVVVVAINGAVPKAAGGAAIAVTIAAALEVSGKGVRCARGAVCDIVAGAVPKAAGGAAIAVTIAAALEVSGKGVRCILFARTEKARGAVCDIVAWAEMAIDQIYYTENNFVVLFRPRHTYLLCQAMLQPFARPSSQSPVLVIFFFNSTL
jgi:hypothetical protein